MIEKPIKPEKAPIPKEGGGAPAQPTAPIPPYPPRGPPNWPPGGGTPAWPETPYRTPGKSRKSR
jgi:hypothetical protein